MTAILNSSIVFSKAFTDHAAVIRSLELQQPLLQTIAGELAKSIRNRHKIFWCGNGGSAADSQHLAAELVGRFRRDRRGLPSIALTTDTSILTAIANDFGYEDVFRRQVEALGEPGDVLVGIFFGRENIEGQALAGFIEHALRLLGLLEQVRNLAERGDAGNDARAEQT